MAVLFPEIYRYNYSIFIIAGYIRATTLIENISKKIKIFKIVVARVFQSPVFFA